MLARQRRGVSAPGSTNSYPTGTGQVVPIDP
jgi:hypothetical protein